MQKTNISRRDFLHHAGTGLVAGVGAAVVAPSIGYAANTLPGAVAPAIRAGDVIDRIKQHVLIPWRETTVDTIKGGGNPEIIVTGITTTFMATLDVLQRSVKTGNNVVIAHEPTFWNNLDTNDGFTRDPLYNHKLQFIQSNRLLVHRFHDHWHARRPDGITQGWNRVLGWDQYRFDEGLQAFELPERTTLLAYARELKSRLKSDCVRVVGDPQLPVRTVSKGSNKLPRAGVPPCLADITVTYEPDRENDNVEWERDTAACTKRGFIIVSHNRLEEFGMDNCAAWLRTFVPEVPIQFIPSGDPFWRTLT